MNTADSRRRRCCFYHDASKTRINSINFRDDEAISINCVFLTVTDAKPPVVSAIVNPLKHSGIRWLYFEVFSSMPSSSNLHF